MKTSKIITLTVCILVQASFCFPEEMQSSVPANQYFDKMGEVYFVASLSSPSDFARISSSCVSIDRVDGSNVYAYANRKEFEQFLSTGCYYEVLKHPSTLIVNPPMSDYSNVRFPLFDWTKYPTYDGYLKIMEELKKTYPDKVTYQKIGQSIKGKDLLVATVSKNVGVRDCEPKFLINAGIHGDELFPIMMSMRLIDWLCSNYGKDARATRIIDSIDLWISPMLNPDGTYKGGNNTVQGATRYNANTVDMNRNYTIIPGAGTSPVPEPETKLYLAFEKQHNFVMQIGYHSGVEGISYPWSAIAAKHLDDLWYNYASRLYADEAQKNGPSTFFDDINNGAGQGYQHLYPAPGTEKDCLLHFYHIRANCIESAAEKIMAESNLENYWNYHRDALLLYIQEVLNGIRGTVVDSLTGKGLQAKVFVENHDKDSTFVYSDVPHGNFYRPIYQGTYSVTFSAKDYVSKTVQNVQVQNGKPTVLAVKLRSTITGGLTPGIPGYDDINVSGLRQGIRVGWSGKYQPRSISVYDLSGTQIVHVSADPSANAAVMCNTGKYSAGWYIVKIAFAHSEVIRSVLLVR